MPTEVAGDFEWDTVKALANARKHGVTFMEAVRAFLDPLALDLPDATDPNRLVLIGLTCRTGSSTSCTLRRPRRAGSASSAPAGRHAMKRRATKSAEPSKASLAEMPEVDFSKASKPSRGKYAERARRSLEVIVLDKKLVSALGGPDRVAGILRAVAEAVAEKKPRRPRAA